MSSKAVTVNDASCERKKYANILPILLVAIQFLPVTWTAPLKVYRLDKSGIHHLPVGDVVRPSG